MIGKQNLVVLLLSLVLSFAVFGNGIRGDFVYDDTFGIQLRQDLKDPRNLFKLFVSPYYFQQPEIGLYRPLPMLTYMLNFSFFGQSPVSFKIVNILLHSFCAFLLFQVIKFLFSFKLALFSFLLFLLHPLHTEAIALIVGRAELLATLLSLATIYFFLKKRFIYSYIAFLLALFSKEIAIMTLPIIFYIEWVRGQSLKSFLKMRVLRNYLLFVIPLFFYLSLRFIALGKFIFYARATDFVENPLVFIPFSEKIFTAFKVLYLYVEKLIFPLQLTNDYSFSVIKIVTNPLLSIETTFGILIFICLVTLILHPKTRSTPLGIGSVLFLFPYIVISNLVMTIGTIMAERLVYFSSVGFCLILAFFIHKMRSGHKKVWPEVVWGILIIILIFYGARTIIRNEDWLTNDKLYIGNLKNHPEGFLTQLYWGTALINKGQMDEAKKHLNEAQKIYPDNPRLIIVFGALAELDGNDALAESYYKTALEKYDLAIEAYSKLGFLYFSQERYEEAQEFFLRAIQLYPTAQEATYYARTQIQLEHPEKGIEIIHKYFGDNPQDLEVVTALGYSYYLKEDYNNALKYLKRSKALGNTNPEIDNMMAISEAMLENEKSSQ